MRGTPSAPSISPHRHGLGVVLDILEVGEGAGELPAVDGLRRLARVLVRDTEVGAASARRLGGLEVGGCVSDLCEDRLVSRRSSLPQSPSAHAIPSLRLSMCGLGVVVVNRKTSSPLANFQSVQQNWMSWREWASLARWGSFAELPHLELEISSFAALRILDLRSATITRQ